MVSSSAESPQAFAQALLTAVWSPVPYLLLLTLSPDRRGDRVKTKRMIIRADNPIYSCKGVHIELSFACIEAL